MTSCIGKAFDRSGALVVASVTGLLAVAADMLLVWWSYYPASGEGRWLIALTSIGIFHHLAGGDGPSLGLARPAQGWFYWVRLALLIGLVMAMVLVTAGGVWVLLERTLPVYSTSPDRLGRRLLSMCVLAPVLEETLYRLVLCVPLAAWIGHWGAIAVSGLLFGVLHIVYGVPSPENLVGGFVLAWAFLKSESILVPVVLHSLGNLCVLAAQVAAWFWLQSQTDLPSFLEIHP